MTPGSVSRHGGEETTYPSRPDKGAGSAGPPYLPKRRRLSLPGRSQIPGPQTSKKKTALIDDLCDNTKKGKGEVKRKDHREERRRDWLPGLLIGRAITPRLGEAGIFSSKALGTAGPPGISRTL